jgi:hypothetical protein
MANALDTKNITKHNTLSIPRIVNSFEPCKQELPALPSIILPFPHCSLIAVDAQSPDVDDKRLACPRGFC